jgi:hypothetical protein
LAFKEHFAVIWPEQTGDDLDAVDLPAPLGPRKPTTSPDATMKLTSWMAGMPRPAFEKAFVAQA